MRQLVEDVAAFHRNIGYDDTHGRRLDAGIIRRRLAFIDEEARELHEAMSEAACVGESGELAPESVEAAHLVQELIDLTYVIAGTFLELGIDPEPAWQAVHAANMRKVASPGGGKAVKPAGWQAPLVPVEPLRLESEVVKQGALTI